jgi:hypothetical protein
MAIAQELGEPRKYDSHIATWKIFTAREVRFFGDV